MKQHDEASAGAVIPTKEELQAEIDNKQKEKVKYQNEYRRQYLACMYMNTELAELRDIHNDYNNLLIKNTITKEAKFGLNDGTIIYGEWKLKKEGKNILYGYIETKEGLIYTTDKVKKTYRLYPEKVETVNYDNIPKNKFGLPYTKQLLRWEFEIKENTLQELVSKLNFMSQEILKLGFTKKQIEDIKYKGKYIKDSKKLDDMEEKWLKENNPGWGKEVD